MKNVLTKAPQILNASSNLLGICFIVLTSLKVLNISKKLSLMMSPLSQLLYLWPVACFHFFPVEEVALKV